MVKREKKSWGKRQSDGKEGRRKEGAGKRRGDGEEREMQEKGERKDEEKVEGRRW